MEIAVLGDYNANYSPHRATTWSLEHAAANMGIKINITWVPTEKLTGDSSWVKEGYRGVWLGPAPYINESGVKRAVKYIRTNNIPFLATCGGLYQAMIEFGVNVMHLDEKLFEKRSDGTGIDFFVLDTNCGIHGFKKITFKTIENTKTWRCYKKTDCEEDSNCGFSINPRYYSLLEEHGLKISAKDDQNEAKAFELSSNVFYILTKFLPQMRSVMNAPHPLVSAFLKAASDSD